MASVQRYRTPHGERRYRVRYRDAAGREHSRSFLLAKDADRFRIDVERRAQLGALYVAPAVTFGEFADQWFDRWVTRRRPAPSTAVGVRRNLQQHLAPLRSLRLEAITAAMFEDVIHLIACELRDAEGNVEKRANPRTAQHAFETGRRVLKDAQARGQTVDHTIFDLARPANIERDPMFLTWEQVRQLAGESTEPHLIMFAALTGLRIGELAALRDEDLHLANGEIVVRRSGFRGEAWQRTKTKHSVRRIPLSKTALRVLREQLIARTPSRFVFPHDVGDGDQWTQRALHRRFHRALRRVPELAEMHFHDLRHTYVSLMAAAGVGAAEIAAMVGHADGGVLVARRYRHLFPDALTNSANRLDQHIRDEHDDDAEEAAEA